jgi:hypothetical protein
MTQKKTVEIRFNQQQYKLIDDLRTEGIFGENDGDIVIGVFRAYLREVLMAEK